MLRACRRARRNAFRNSRRGADEARADAETARRLRDADSTSASLARLCLCTARYIEKRRRARRDAMTPREPLPDARTADGRPCCIAVARESDAPTTHGRARRGSAWPRSTGSAHIDIPKSTSHDAEPRREPCRVSPRRLLSEKGPKKPRTRAQPVRCESYSRAREALTGNVTTSRVYKNLWRRCVRSTTRALALGARRHTEAQRESNLRRTD